MDIIGLEFIVMNDGRISSYMIGCPSIKLI